MNLRCRPFERAMWERVKQHDPRRRMSFWQKVVYILNSKTAPPFWIFRILGAIILGWMLFNTHETMQHDVPWTLTVAAVIGLGIIYAHVNFIALTAELQTDYRTLWMLPLTVNSIFRRFRKRIILSSLLLLPNCAILYGLIASVSNRPQLAWSSAAACAVLQWLLCLSLTCLLAATQSKKEVSPIPLIAGLGLLGFAGMSPDWMQYLVKIINIVVPVSWTNSFFYEGILQGNHSANWLLLPICLVLGTLPYSYCRIKQLHNTGVFLTVPNRRKFNRYTTNGMLKTETPTTPAFTIWTAVVQWERLGIIERCIGRILNAREQVIAEALAASPFDWSNRFWKFLVYLFLFLLTGLFIEQKAPETLVGEIIQNKGRLFPILAPWGLSLVLIAILMVRLANLLFWFGGLEHRNNESKQTDIQTFRLAPINYWQSSKVLAKVQTALLLLLIPAFLAISISTLWQTIVDNTQASTFGPLKGLFLFWGLGMMMITLDWIPNFEFSWTWWKTFARYIAAKLISIFLGFASIIAPQPWDWMLTAIFVMTVTAWFFYCGARYQAMR